MYELRMMMKGHSGLLDLLVMRGFAVVLARLFSPVFHFSRSSPVTLTTWMKGGTYAVLASKQRLM